MFLDTSIIVEIFCSDQETKTFREIYELIEDEPLFISLIQFGEISDWCLKNDSDPVEHLSQIKRIASIVSLDETLCIEGSKIKNKYRKEGVRYFSLIDGIILASARSINQSLLTKDSDFRKAADAVVLDI